MRIDGDIRVWTDGHKACARLCADGPEGPIIIQASAPLGPIKRMVARMFARRGVNVSGSDAAYTATVHHVARKKALRRLRRLAPRAFARGSLAPYLASQELARRNRMRFALERTGQEAGPKSLGPVLLKKRRRRRGHGRRFFGPGMPGLLARPMLPAAAATALALARPTPGSPALPALPQAAGGGGATPRAAQDQEAPMTDPTDDADAGEAQPGDEPQGTGRGSEGADNQDAPDDESEGAPDSDEGNEDPGDEETESPDESGVSGATPSALIRRREALRRALARRQLRAALRFLRSARHSPHARRRLRQLATLAGEGDPKARKAIKVLAVAHKMDRHGRVGRGMPATGKPIGGRNAALPSTSAAPPPLPLPPVPARPGGSPAGTPAAATPTEAVRWWDILAAWRRRMG